MSSAPSATQSTKAATAAPPRGKPPDTEGLLREAFDDIALVIGGVAVIHHLDDDLIWTLMKRLDRIRVRLLRDLKGLTPRQEFEPALPKAPRVHAAVEEFLLRNRAESGE
jgi:hypothetical protein